MPKSLKKIESINELLEVYGNILSDKQKDILSDYYVHDLSLQEIAKIKNISRAAVLDAINKASDKLLEEEEKIGYLKIKSRALALIEKLKEDNKKEILEELERLLKYGI